MCDYSLMAVPNRLAQEREELVTHRFPTGSLGLASPADIARAAIAAAPTRKSFFAMLKEFFNPPASSPVCAVCIPPGARLLVQNIPQRLQQSLVVSACEEVTFTQLSAAANTYRDAIRFSNGRDLRLQELREGMHVTVLDLSAAEELDLEALRLEREPVRVR
ncbi:MAG TPA: hypothetical protein VKE70_30385 [Candidatus Solibacter sp.]|nr:hypothetical protein [Candidatus Solibacter sp.]